MINARAFQQAFSATAGSSPLYGAAGRHNISAAKRLPIKAAPTDGEIKAALVAAEARLKAQPESLSGDPNGIFTFEDPGACRSPLLVAQVRSFA